MESIRNCFLPTGVPAPVTFDNEPDLLAPFMSVVSAEIGKGFERSVNCGSKRPYAMG